MTGAFSSVTLGIKIAGEQGQHAESWAGQEWVMDQQLFQTESKLWRWASASGRGNMHFLTIAGPVGDEIRAWAYAGPWLGGKMGFGSVKVEVTIGETRWSTSLFPHKESGGWLLPVKAAVRRAESLEVGKITPLVIRL